MKDQYLLLYQKFLDNLCTDQELKLLFQYFETADEGELKRLINLELQSNFVDSAATAQEAERLAVVHRLVRAQMNRPKFNIRTLVYRLSAAAAIIVALTFTVKLFWHPNQSQPVNQQQQAVVITPGRHQATLTLANGKKIVLNSSLSGTLARLGNISVQISQSKGVSYTLKNADHATKSAYNTLATSRGEQSPYPLILADGSKVWLNAASSITFPSEFTGKERVVKISGEAYFEVAHNKALPFKVITENQEIRVLGTHFNVKSYADDASISTTLLEGSVKINDLSSGASGMLLPGQQARLNKGSRQIAITAANMDEVIAWKNGFFMFDNQKITGIMKSISRWYDVEVEYKNLNNNERFGGTFSRSSNLADILNNLQSLGKVHFTVNKRKIVVGN